MHPKKALAIYIEIASQPKEHQKTVEVVKNAMKKYGCKCRFVPRSRFSKRMLRGVDLLLTIGGDGTFLKVAQHVTKPIPLLGVNSNIMTKEGFTCNSNRRDFPEKFERIQQGKFKVVKLNRIECKIGKKVIEPALNEIFFGHVKPYKLSRYTLAIKDKKELQRSSGVILGTATGSNAWLRSVGAKLMKRTSKELQLFVREPHKGKFIRATMIKRMLKPKEVLIIKPKEKEHIILADSVGTEYNVKIGDKITLKQSPYPLHSIFF